MPSRSRLFRLEPTTLLSAMASLSRNACLLLSIFLIARLFTLAWQNSDTVSRLHAKRSLDAGLSASNECDNIIYQNDQCAFAKQYCAGTSPGLIDYLEWYFCASGVARPVIFIVLCAWLLFLFGFVGIAASDFFCPNLQTIASALKLSESLTGVTFLAFGNGSPDLFSTFSAMHADMGSLALGELIGAAAFIVSVVAGSMCAIKPFRTKKFGFLRDVSFFTVAIILLMGIVADGLIYLYEAILLVVFYVVYVFVVVGGNYYMKRRSTYKNLVQRARLEYEETGPEVDNLLRGNMWDEELVGADEMELYDEGFETEGYHRQRGSAHPKLRIRTSLFSAIEFQDVVRSLQRTNHRFTHHHHIRSRAPTTTTAADVTSDVPLSPRGAMPPDSASEHGYATYEPSQQCLRLGRIKLPIDVVDLNEISFHLFPSVANFSQKSIYSKISSIISVPVIFLLAVTLPVVKESAVKQNNSVRLDDDAIAMLQDIPATAAEENDPAEMNELSESTATWSQWMTATQLVCAPMFFATVLSVNDVVPAVIIMPIAAVLGVATAIFFKLTTNPAVQPRLYWMMSFVGFSIAVVWIYVIANEVVSVLQTIGIALGISDAILGLTVFAVGNSLGDLVANVTVARMGYPMMAMSACFGGPMLNIMLGMGIGATYVTSQRNAPYVIDVSKTILVSAIGLLTVLVILLVFVPLNHFRMSRMFGLASIIIYLTCTAINLYIEITS